MKRAHTSNETGAITLLVAIALVVLATLASFYSTHSVLLDHLASQNQHSASQTRLAAEAALAWARADVARAYTSIAQASLWWHDTPNTPCPSGHEGPRWQCRLMFPPDGSEPSGMLMQVVAARDVLTSPHVIELHASAIQTSDTHPGSRAQVRASIFVPAMAPTPALASASQAALLLQGCILPTPGSTLKVCPFGSSNSACNGPTTGALGPAVQSFWLSDTDGDGRISNAERLACLALLPAHLPGGGDVTGPSTALPRSPCGLEAWRSVLGDATPEQIQAWSAAQAQNGLNAQSQPPRSIYWIDSPATWTQSLGQGDAPVLLIFSATACALRCPSLADGVQILGTVVLQTRCQDEKAQGWRGGRIEGQLVVESGLPDWPSGSHIQARRFVRNAYQVDWPEGIDATQVQRIAGSWQEGAR